MHLLQIPYVIFPSEKKDIYHNSIGYVVGTNKPQNSVSYHNIITSINEKFIFH